MSLTASQVEALDALHAFVSVDGENQTSFFCLTGAAGTGKTSVIGTFCAEMQEKSKLTIGCCAPTHKAKVVLEEKIGGNIECHTLQSLLAYRPVRQENGSMVFKTSRPLHDLPIHAYDVLIIDEASMVPAEMLAVIKAARYGGHVVFVGDVFQLPPVGEERSVVFEAALPSDCVRLTEVVRHDGGILDLVTKFRHGMEGKITLSFDRSFFEGYDGVTVCGTKGELMQAAMAKMPAGRLLCYTNALVSRLNKVVRHKLFGPDADEFVVGDHICTAENTNDSIGTSLPSSLEMVVSAVFVEQKEVFGTELTLYNITTAEGVKMYVPVQASEVAYKTIESRIKAACRRSRKWHMYAKLQTYCTKLTHCYALTIHKAQGSTYNDVFVPLDNLLINRDRAEMLKLVYTALTRAAKSLTIGMGG